MIRKTNLGISSADHDRVDAYIRTTDTDWTLARLAALSNSEKEKKLVISYANAPKPAMFVGRRQVAKFLVDSFNDRSLYQKAPVISER
ncbi:NAD(P)H-binding protein [Rhizobium sp. PDO1-076]|uniref:NAD(P)H-binding protein n=1 Tax=Rhizobium sp. PDO1-076 TaxID=1125979 RepID=UPI001360B37F|nr:NAD(P)H-binding protein [Rhizobium sp. PDO1-076]